MAQACWSKVPNGNWQRLLRPRSFVSSSCRVHQVSPVMCFSSAGFPFVSESRNTKYLRKARHAVCALALEMKPQASTLLIKLMPASVQPLRAAARYKTPRSSLISTTPRQGQLGVSRALNPLPQQAFIYLPCTPRPCQTLLYYQPM